MKTLTKILIVVAILIGIFVLGHVLNEKDPAYQSHPATYYGRPAFVQLHRYNEWGDGQQWITFYYADNADLKRNDPVKDSKNWVIGREICTVPTELAISMYHAQPSYPK